MSTTANGARRNSMIRSLGSLRLARRRSSVSSTSSGDSGPVRTATSRRVSMISDTERHIDNEFLPGDGHAEGRQSATSLRKLQTHTSNKSITGEGSHDRLFSPIMFAEAMASTSAFDRLIDYSSPTAATIGGPSRSLATMNRAQVLIDRLDGWALVLKEASTWLDEVAKINALSSQQYYQRALPHVEWNDERVQRGTALGITVAGLRFLTAHVAAKQKEATEKIRKEYLNQLKDLRRECKVKLEDLQASRSLHMGELLKRAESTQRHIRQLDKLCKAADLAGGQVKHDPWLENLYLLRDLKRETDEDNRLRKLMVTIQQQMAELESRIIEVLKPSLQFCYQHFFGGLKESSKEAKRYKQYLEQIDAEKEWAKFLSTQKDLVRGADKAIRHYLQINYKNKSHRSVMTISKGNAIRLAAGIGRQPMERFYVLTQCGFLHEFSLKDNITPVSSIFIPSTKITPSININHPTENDSAFPGEYTIQIKRTSILQRDKTVVIRFNGRDELVAWSRPMLQVSARYKITPPWRGIQRRSTTGGVVDRRIALATPNKHDFSDTHLPRRSATDPSLEITKSGTDLSKRRISDPLASTSSSAQNLNHGRRSEEVSDLRNTVAEMADAEVPAIHNQDEITQAKQVHSTSQEHQKQQKEAHQDSSTKTAMLVEAYTASGGYNYAQKPKAVQKGAGAATDAGGKSNADLSNGDWEAAASTKPLMSLPIPSTHESNTIEPKKAEVDEKDSTTTAQPVGHFECGSSTIYIPQLRSVVAPHIPFGIDKTENDSADDSVMNDAF